MMSAKNEKHSLLATLWFQVAHFALRPWPWLIVALAALVIYPDATDKGATFIMVIRDYLPAGLLGLLLAAFLAAFMSTVASQTVWGTSYIVNDLVRPFIKKDGDEKYYVAVSRLTTIVLLIFSLVFTSFFSRISDAWKFILACSGGIGVVLILRWFWWRINAWSEIAAMLAPYVIFPILLFVFDWDVYHADFGKSLIVIVGWSVLVWLPVTFFTRPSSHETLKSFYRTVHPGGRGWRKIAVEMPEVKGDSSYGYLFMSWIMGCILVISVLFGIGDLVFGEWGRATISFGFSALAVAGIIIAMRRYGWKNII